jgi:lipid A disaccharide synthetase
VAEEVQTVSPNLATRDCDRKPFTALYDVVNAMLLNEFLKEHCKVKQLTKDFESQLVEQQKQIEALTAGLQKVSDRLELSKPAPQIVVDEQ